MSVSASLFAARRDRKVSISTQLVWPSIPVPDQPKSPGPPINAPVLSFDTPDCALDIPAVEAAIVLFFMSSHHR
jgi:hypothetical protein